MKKILLVMRDLLKAHVGPYMRGGKMVNKNGYDTKRTKRAVVVPGQKSLFGAADAAEKKPAKKDAKLDKAKPTAPAAVPASPAAAKVGEKITDVQKSTIKNAREYRKKHGNSPKSFAEIPDGGLIAQSGTAQGGSQNVFKFGDELVCVSIVDGYFDKVTRITKVEESMKDKYTAMYTKNNEQHHG